MTQASQFFSYAASNIASSDLSTIDSCLDALFSNNSGAGTPPNSTGIPGFSWYDTSLPTADGGLLKIKRVGSGWDGVLSGSSSFKIWVYLDVLTAEEGWVRDSSMSDQVLALKGGTTYTTGAQKDKGSWEISGITAADHDEHGHRWFLENENAFLSDQSWNYWGTAINFIPSDVPKDSSSYRTIRVEGGITGGKNDYYTEREGVSSHSMASDSSWRIKASVGIMVYPDV